MRAFARGGLEQLTHRTRVGASPADVTHYVHDIWGNIIAETFYIALRMPTRIRAGGGPTGATGTVSEYITLPEAEIAPTFGRTTVVPVRGGAS